MAIQHLVNQTVDSLNALIPAGGWQCHIWPDNVRPWARIFHNSMVLNWPATQQNPYPVFCFEIKCVNDRPAHDGTGPYSIYINLESKDRVKNPEHIIPCLDHIQNQLHTITNITWREQLSEGVNTYRGNLKRFELDPRLVLDDSYLDTAVGYVMLRKQLFL